MCVKQYTLLFLAALIICLIQVWVSPYFITGDGAVHVYNAAMLKDYWQGMHQSFYSAFYSLNRQIDPNWFSHIILAVLMYGVSGAVAEKVLLTFYIIVYATGFRKLITLSGGNKYLGVAGMLLILNHTLVKGFYNFNISIALSLWMVCAWLIFLQNSTIRNYLLFILLVFTTFLAHAAGLTYGIVLCAMLTVSVMLSDDANLPAKRWRALFKKLSLLFIGTLPCIILLLQYSSRHASGFTFELHTERLQQFLLFPDYNTHTSAEGAWGRVMAYTLLAIFVLSLIIPRLREKIRLSQVGGIVFVCVAFIIYLLIPAEMGGGSMLDMRARQLACLSIAISLAHIPARDGFAKFSGILLFILLAVISFIRLPVIIRAGAATAEYVSVTEKVKPYSTLLPLSFSHNGRNMDASYIVNRNWVFQHAIGYAGAGKPLIIMDNYAANTGYFPFIWIPESNPYLNLSISPGHEDQLPNADIVHYEFESRKTIDYIVTWCYEPEYRNTAHVDSLFKFIEKNYDIAAVSSNGRAMLYERKRNK